MSQRRTKPTHKRLADFPKPYRDALAVWSALRRLGFDSDDIFVGFQDAPGEDGRDMLFVQLNTQGKKFSTLVAQIPGAKQATVFKTWQEAAVMYNEAPDSDREACFRESMLGVVDYFITFTSMILESGIIVPNEHILRAISQGQA